MPPMAYVEEEILEELIEVPPDSLLYMVLDPRIDPTPTLQQWIQRQQWRDLLALSKRKSPG
jgi:hypothetical protein